MITYTAPHIANQTDDLVVRYHVTALRNFFHGYDKYSRVYSKANIAESRYPNWFFLLRDQELAIGIEKARRLHNKLGDASLPVVIIATTQAPTDIQANTVTGTGIGEYIDSDGVTVTQCYLLDPSTDINRNQQHLLATAKKVAVEDVIALAYQHCLPEKSIAFNTLTPRSVSLLPVAQGCQAKCDFCFSAASISDDVSQLKIDWQRIEHVLRTAQLHGAERAVITGGGEPGLLPLKRLTKMVALCRDYYEKVVLISNGYFIERAPLDSLQQLTASGLGVLAISYHHYDTSKAEDIMHLAVNLPKIAKAWTQLAPISAKLRLICVLQKGGIESENDIRQYLIWAASLGIREVCFKELYVASSHESLYFAHGANQWSYAHQVPLAKVLAVAEQDGWEKAHELPWGSPVFRTMVNDVPIQIAAYTEPSVAWELNNGSCRSWNLMADGQCYASLETLASAVVSTEE